jgi:hypothetical protein
MGRYVGLYGGERSRADPGRGVGGRGGAGVGVGGGERRGGGGALSYGYTAQWRMGAKRRAENLFLSDFLPSRGGSSEGRDGGIRKLENAKREGGGEGKVKGREGKIEGGRKRKGMLEGGKGKGIREVEEEVEKKGRREKRKGKREKGKEKEKCEERMKSERKRESGLLRSELLPAFYQDDR